MARRGSCDADSPVEKLECPSLRHGYRTYCIRWNSLLRSIVAAPQRNPQFRHPFWSHHPGAKPGPGGVAAEAGPEAPALCARATGPPSSREQREVTSCNSSRTINIESEGGAQRLRAQQEAAGSGDSSLLSCRDLRFRNGQLEFLQLDSLHMPHLKLSQNRIPQEPRKQFTSIAACSIRIV